MAINAIGNGIPFPRGEGIPSAVRDSMVLWYDLKRQGSTNETMAANPKLIDLSGNGHDATCYNFTWSGMSSIGGYNQSPLSGSSYKRTVIPPQGKSWFSLYAKSTYNKNKSWTIKVTCDTKPFTEADNIFVFTRNVTTGEIYRLTDNIVNNIPLTIPTYDGEILEDGVWLNLNHLINNNVTIEILPEYPNALVSDGVDDYALCSTLPTLDDFTIVAKRKILNDSFCFASASDVANKGAFVLESDYSTQFMVNSFGADNSTSRAVDDIIYMTPTSYNGTAITRGTNNEGNNLNLFRVRNGDSRYMKGVLYSFILFNRTLTTKEINWVKENLIEGDTEL